MRNQSFYQLLVLFLTGACIFWSGCETPETDCDDPITVLNISGFCFTPDPVVFNNLTADDNDVNLSVLPDLCSSDYGQSRVVKIQNPNNNLITLHQFLNFPGKIVTEVFGSNCENGFDPLLEDCAESTDVVTVYTVDPTGYEFIYVRVIYSGIGDYVPGIRDDIDDITLIAYSGEPNFEIFERIDRGSGVEVIYKNCNGTETNRIILSGPNAIETAIASGLPVQGCECSDGRLVTVSAPVGVDLNTLRPKVRQKPAEPDTTNTYKDLILSVPLLTFPNSNDNPAGDENITGNSCLDFNSPTTGSSGGDDVIVTIVDSGVDTDTHGGVFAINGLNNSTTGCLNFGTFGTDLTDGDDLPNDEIGHGTAVASAVISGYNSNRGLTVINNKFFNNDGGSLFNGICGAYAGVEAGSHIINLSWGFKSTEEPDAMREFLDYAQNQNVVIVASAGNSGEFINDFFHWPALFGNDYPNMLTVASYKFSNDSPQQEVKTDWSNFSSFDVEIAALYGRECLQLNGGEWYPAGTSISAPIVTGQLANLKAVNFSASAEQLVNEFLNNLASTNPTLDDTTIGGKFLGRPNPADSCLPFKESF